MRAVQTLELPDPTAMLLAFRELAGQVEPLSRYLAAAGRDHFIHPDGRTDPHGTIWLEPVQAALLSYLARKCPRPLSVETGFGMGSSAAVIMGTRKAVAEPFEHVAFDPYGLPDKRGTVVESYLCETFGSAFRRVRERSEIGLAKLIGEKGEGSAGLIYIDGCHRFENVVADFVLADLICCHGGYIVFDDALYPAIETAIGYIAANRPDYALAHLPVPNLSVLQKRARDARTWDAFTPFSVSERSGWAKNPLPRTLWTRLRSRFR